LDLNKCYKDTHQIFHLYLKESLGFEPFFVPYPIYIDLLNINFFANHCATFLKGGTNENQNPLQDSYLDQKPISEENSLLVLQTIFLSWWIDSNNFSRFDFSEPKVYAQIKPIFLTDYLDLLMAVYIDSENISDQDDLEKYIQLNFIENFSNDQFFEVVHEAKYYTTHLTSDFLPGFKL